MHSNRIIFPIADVETRDLSRKKDEAIDYDRTFQQFVQLIQVEDLDKQLTTEPSLVSQFEEAVAAAVTAAYEKEPGDDAAHLFLQRVLYQINRLKLFWYDDLRNYTNENSLYLTLLRDRIESVWQAWEIDKFNIDSYKNIDIKQALKDRVAADVDPPISENGLFFRDQMTKTGYRRLLAIASLDGLVEASQLSRTLGGVANEIQCVLTRLLVEEYGAGRLGRKHSTHFATMLLDMGMETEPEAYFEFVPWELLTIINHSFILSDRKRYFLRYVGGLLYGELSVPAAFRNYQAAGERLGLSPEAMAYWSLHIKVDELHGRWMIDDAALPLVDRYPQDAWELVLGYDQQRYMSDRASDAVTRSVKQAEEMP